MCVLHLTVSPPVLSPWPQTSSANVQDVIESRVEKRTKGVYVPLGSKKLITFMDDFNMPAKDTFGSQPPLELIRLWIDYGFWYNRSNQTTLKILVGLCVQRCSLVPVQVELEAFLRLVLSPHSLCRFFYVLCHLRHSVLSSFSF